MKNAKKDYTPQIAYIHGRIEAQLEGFAASLGVPPVELTRRVGELLAGSMAGRESLGSSDFLSDLRRESTRLSKSLAAQAVASDSYIRSAYNKKVHRTRVRKPATKKAIAARTRGLKRYWREQRRLKRELLRRKAA